MAIKLTEAAVKKVNELLNSTEGLPKDVFLRMGVEGGGCSGLSYSLEFGHELGPHDKVFPTEEMKKEGIDWGFNVVIDPKSYLYLNGTILDYVTQGLTGGFTFINPQAKSTCGCGTSFSPDTPKKGEDK